MDKVQVIAFVGMPGAGKSFCVEYLTKKGFPSAYFGGVVLDKIKNHGLDVNEENEKNVREGLRKKEGNGALAKRIIQKIVDLGIDGHKKVIVDGLYSWTEYKIFKDHFGDNAVIVAIAAPRHLRHERLANRPVRPLTDKEVTSREYAEIENLEKGGPIANADYTLINDSAPENLLRQLDGVLKATGFLG